MNLVQRKVAHERLSKIASLAKVDGLGGKGLFLNAGFPEQETYGVVSQIRRAIMRSSRYRQISPKAYQRTYQGVSHHLSMAQASLAEVETQLEIAARLKYLRSDQLGELLP